MNNVAGAILLCLTLIAPMVVYGAYLVLRRFKSGRRIGLGLAVLVLLALGLAAVQTMAGGSAVEGVVLAKSERVQLARRQLIPSVLHILRVQVRVGAAADGDGGDTLTLQLSPAAFDRLRVGGPVRLMQSRLGPMRFARVADAPAWSQWPEAEFTGLLDLFAGLASLVALGFGVLTPAMAWRGRLAFVALALMALVLDGLATRPWWAPRPAQGSATIVEARTVTQALVPSRLFSHYTEEFRLPKAYDEVTLRLVPAPGADPVTAVDRVDVGTAGALTPGSVVAVSYDPAAPRDARLTRGARDYALAAYQARFGGRAALGALVAAALFVVMIVLARRQARLAKVARASTAHQGVMSMGPTKVTDR